MSEITTSSKTIRRKIQVVGGNTITVSLPRSWAKKHRLGKGTDEEQELKMRYLPDGSLMVSPSGLTNTYQERTRTHLLSAMPTSDTIKRMLLADFIGGIDVINLKLPKTLDQNVVHDLQSFVDRRLIGFDLIETPPYIQAINMTQAPIFDVHRLMEIIRVQTTSMLDSVIEWIEHPDIDMQIMVARMEEWETKVDRHSNQLMRTLQLAILDFWLAEKVNLPMAEVLYWSSAVKAAESTSDLALAITELTSVFDMRETPVAVRQEILGFAKNSRELFSKAMTSFISSDYEQAHVVLEDQATHSVLKKKKWPISDIEDQSSSLVLITRHLDRVSSHARKIAEATVDCEAASIAYEDITHDN